MKTLVVNSSPNHDGNSVRLAQNLLMISQYEILHLNDYCLAQLSQLNVQDDFERIFKKIEQADRIVFATPIYWHDMTGSMKLLLDRISEDVDWESSHMVDKKLSCLLKEHRLHRNP